MEQQELEAARALIAFARDYARIVYANLEEVNADRAVSDILDEAAILEEYLSSGYDADGAFGVSE